MSFAFASGSCQKIRPKRIGRMDRPKAIGRGRVTMPADDDSAADLVRTAPGVLIYPADDVNQSKREKLAKWARARSVWLIPVETSVNTSGHESVTCYRAMGPGEALAELLATDFLDRWEFDVPVRVLSASGNGVEKVKTSGPPRPFAKPHSGRCRCEACAASRNAPAAPPPPADWYAVIAKSAERWRRDNGHYCDRKECPFARD